MIFLPTCGSNPARVAYAKLCGITVRPTVTPAMRSQMNLSELYSGIHDKTGTQRYTEAFNLFIHAVRLFSKLPTVAGNDIRNAFNW